MHDKFALVETPARRRSAFGSFNWNEASRRFNREIGVVSGDGPLFEAFAERWAELRRYAEQVPATIAAYGGEYLVRGGAMETVEGQWPERRHVILKFPSMDKARAWYASAAYRGPRALRQASSQGNAVLLEGYDG